MKWRLVNNLIIAFLATLSEAKTVTVGPGDNAGQKAAMCAAGDTMELLSGASANGIATNGVYWVVADASSVAITNDTINGVPSGDAIYIGGGMHDSTISNNKITNCPSTTGIYGYPGNRNKINNNLFDYVNEPVHLIAACDTIDVSGNVITHATRIGIELQDGMTHLTVENNWMSDWLPHLDPNGIDSHIGISAATGGHGSGANGNSAPWVAFGEHIEIAHNTLIQNGPQQSNALWAKSAIEDMGDLDVSVHDNYAWNWGSFLLYSTIIPTLSSNNVVVGGNLYQADGALWPQPPPADTNDTLYALNDAGAPPIPAKHGNIVLPPSPDAAPAPTLTATSTTTSITFSFPATSSAGTFTVQIKGNGAIVGTFPVALGQRSILVADLTPNWEYAGILTLVNQPNQSLVAQTLANAGDARSANGTPATPQATTQPTVAPVATQPTVTHTIQVKSDGTIVVQ